jgi:hypothetical protein
MPPRTDFLTQQRRRIDTRLQELRPAHEEYLTLLEAKQVLEGLKTPSNTGLTAARPGRSPGSGRGGRAATTRARSSNGRRGPRRTTRRRGTGTRADRTLGLIKSKPGITVPQLAERMGIGQNYLYRVTTALQKRGSVKRQGHGFTAI